MLPLITDLIQEPGKKVRETSMDTLMEIVKLLTPEDRGDYILTSILKLSHEYENDLARATALRILNNLSLDLDN